MGINTLLDTISIALKIGKEGYFRANLVDNYLLLLPYHLIKVKSHRLKILKIR